MRKVPHALIAITITTLLASLLVPAILKSPRRVWASPDVLSTQNAPDTPEDSNLALRISQAFPERQTSSYSAGNLLSYLAGQLQAEGWSTEIQPYSIVARVESRSDRGIAFVRTEGENLLALADPESTSLDCLLVAPYDTLFADRAGSPRASSPTPISTSLALEIAGKLNRDSDTSLGAAFVSGHYQYGAGLRALLESLESRGVTVRSAVVIGDIQPSRGLPLIAGPETPVCMVQNLLAKTQAAGLDPFIATTWTLDFLLGRSAGVDGTSPESMAGIEFSGEHDILAGLGIPVITIGFPSSNPTMGLGAAANPDETLGRKIRWTGEAVSSALNAPSDLAGPKTADMQVVRLFGTTYLVPETTGLVSGKAVSLTMAAIALIRIPKDMASLALMVGTAAASALSMLLHFAFSERSKTAYASALYPGRAMALYFCLFTLLLLMAFLRLWSIRSRIRHLHERLPSEAEHEPYGKVTWGSAWGLAVLAALCLGASLARSEILPSLLIAGIAHAAGTLVLWRSSKNKKPGSAALWLARLLYLVPFAAVFWAGNPLSPDFQMIYRSSWTGLNQGSLTSALALAAVFASFLSTLEFPGPASPKALLPMALCEIGMVGLLLVCGFALPASSGPEVPSWAMSEESFSSDTRISFTSPALLTEVTIEGGAPGVPGQLTDRTGMKNMKVGESREVAWASLNLTTSKSDGDETRGALSTTAHASLNKQPDALMLRLREFGALRTTLPGFEVGGLDSLFRPAADRSLPDSTVSVPPGYSVTFVWWRPTNLPAALQFSVSPRGTARVESRLQAFYLDQSYLGITPVTRGVRYYHVTSVIRDSLYR